ncbi:MAG: Ig-like domain repeat protein [Butyrivibrio sp.]|uniref:hypothetical protein n=1 Tax=Butyrivibrio sp. TaxID=28121 RepID=UPI001B3CE511|nr:hypothetical protein [Butyrivibrio sp.]MBP3784969.1 Ig-like domain repeat protein [Butyrivibrio sp.]
MKLRKQFSNLKKGAKKVFIGMLVLCLVSTATGIGSIFAYADECENHYADSYNCYDEHTHIGTCVNCGKEIEAEHSFNSEGKCTVCGYNPGPQNDTDDDNDDGDDGSGDDGSSYGEWQKNDATTHIRYNDAGESETQDHQFTDWVSNGNGVMARVCTVCGYMEEQEDTTGGDTHTHTYTYTDNGDGTHTAVCSECEDTKTEAHNLGNWTSDGRGNHTRTCALCDYSEVEPCSFDENGICTVCGANQADMIIASSKKVMKFSARNMFRGLGATANGGLDESDYEGLYTYSQFYSTAPSVNTGLVYDGSEQELFTIGQLKDSSDLTGMGVTYTNFIPLEAVPERKQTNAETYVYEHTINYKYTDPDDGSEKNGYATGKFTVTIDAADFDNSVTFTPNADSVEYVTLSESAPFFKLTTLSGVSLVMDVDYVCSFSSPVGNTPEIGTSDVVLTFSPFPGSENFTSSNGVTKTIKFGEVGYTFNNSAPPSTGTYDSNGAITVKAPTGYKVSNSANGDFSDQFTYDVKGESTLDVYCKYESTGKIVHKSHSVKISRDLVFDDFITSEPEFNEENTYTGSAVTLASKLPVFNQNLINDPLNKITSFSYYFKEVTSGEEFINSSPTATDCGEYGYKLHIVFKENGADKDLEGSNTYTTRVLKSVSGSYMKFEPKYPDYQSLDPSRVPLLADAFDVYDGSTLLQRNHNYSVTITEPSTAPYETGSVLTYKFDGLNDGTSYYTGTTTKTLPVSRVNVLLNGSAQKSSYDDEVIFTADGYSICDTPDGHFNTEFPFSEPCTNYSLTLYFMNDDTSKIVKQDVTGLNIGPAAAIKLLYDGDEELKPFYYDSVRISAEGYTVSKTRNGTFSENYQLSYDASKNMEPVDDFDLYFKNKTTGLVTLKKVSGINLFESPTIEILYNGTEQKDWYSDNVTITANGYKIATETNRSLVNKYTAKYVMSGSGTVSEPLYFIPKDATTATSSNWKKFNIVVSIDKTAPTGVINLSSYSSDSFTTKDAVKAYTNGSQKATISASDALSGIDYIHYYVSDTFYSSPSDVKAAISEKSGAWRTYSSSSQPALVKDKNNYIYAKLVDKAGNETIISLGNILYDTVAPKMTTAKVTPSSSDSSKTMIGLAGTDKLSGINRFKYVFKEKEEGKKYDTPGKDWMFDNGEVVKTSEEKDGTSVASTSIDALDSEKTYLFYFIAVDRAGNISDVMTQEVKGEAASSNKNSGSGASGGSSAGANGLTPAPNGIAGGGSGSGSKQGGSSGASSGAGSSKSSKSSKSSQSALGDKDREINRNPYIAEATGNVKIGINETSGWNKIASEVNKADKGAVVEVEMAGLSNVSNELFTSMNNRDVQVKLRMAEDVEWEIKGEEVPDARSDIDMGVRLGSRNIPEQIIADVAGTNPHVEFSINHNGDFGFVATIAVPVGESNKGMYTTLYHYDEAKKELEVAGDGRVDDRGYAKFPLTHASDYTVVITPERILTAAETDAQTNTLVGAEAESQSSQYLDGARLRLTDLFRIKGSMRIWLFFIALLSATICMVILYLPALQSRNQNDQGDLF